MIERWWSGWLVLLLAAGGGVARADESATRYTPQQARAELDTLYRSLQEAHFDLYARRPRAEYQRRYHELRDGITSEIEHAALEDLLRRFVAFGGIAHARIDPPESAWETFRSKGGKAFPLRLRVDGDQVAVSEDFSGLDRIAPGDRVLEIDGIPAKAWLDTLRAHIAADSDYMAYTLIEPQTAKLAWLQYGEPSSFRVRRVDARGRPRTVLVPARSRTEFDAATPATTAEPPWDRREARLLDHGIAYLRPGPFYNTTPNAEDLWDAGEFIRFIDSAFEQFIAARAPALLIDLRDNPGGDNSFSDPMLAWIANKPFRFCSRFTVKSSVAARNANRKRLELAPGGDTISARFEAAYAAHAPGRRFDFPMTMVQPRAGRRFQGRVFVLINRHSYSNTVMVAAVAQDYGFATVLGEETSDLASTYGAMESFELPLTGLTVGFPKARIVRPNGRTEARGVVPDVAVVSHIGDSDGEVLRRALAILRTQLQRNSSGAGAPPASAAEAPAEPSGGR